MIRPELLSVVDPTFDDGPQSFRGITYGSGQTVVYFRTTSRLWQVIDAEVSAVQSVDPIFTTMPSYGDFREIPGRGLVFFAESKLWIVEQAGARVLSELDAYFGGVLSSIGNSHYVTAVVNDPQNGWTDRILSISFDANGVATVNLLNMPTNGALYTAFAGGLLVNSNNPGGTQSMHWVNPANGQMQLLATTNQGAYFETALVGVGAGGSSTLYLVENVPGFGQQVLAVQSASLQSGSPTVVTLPMVQTFQGYPTLIGQKLVYGQGVWNGSAEAIKFKVTDGTLAGTSTYTSTLTNNITYINRVPEMVAVGTDVYFAFSPVYSNPVTPSTLVSQVVKFDSVTGVFTTVASFFGGDAGNHSVSRLTATDDGVYFTAWNEDLSGRGIWSYDHTRV